MSAPSQTEDTYGPIERGGNFNFKYSPKQLIGRDEYLGRLDAALDDMGTRIVTLVAWGGVGKTSLVAYWLGLLAQRNWTRLDRVFAWSFYNQGTREQGGASADDFVKTALEFFRDAKFAGSPAAARAKGQRIARLAAEHRTLLVLDGLEPLQHPPGGFLDGQLQDPAIEALLVTLAQSRRSATAGAFCVATTRVPVADLSGFHLTTAPEWELKKLVPEAGAEVLWNAGAKKAGGATIKNHDQELKDASEEVDGHALTLQLLGSYLARAHRGDIRQRALVRFHKADAAVHGGHAFRVMRAYETWLAQSGEDGERQLAALRLLGLFDRPAEPASLAALREPAILGLTEPLAGLGEEEWNLVVAGLESAGLVKTTAWEAKSVKGFGEETAKTCIAYRARGRQFSLGEPEDFTPPYRIRPGEVLDTHPLLRQYFDKRLQETSSAAWREAHRRLYEHFNNSVPYWPEGLDGLQPLYQAVAHGCRVGLYEACLKVLGVRIGRDRAYSMSVLGAFATELGAVAWFFEKPWERLAPALSKAGQARALKTAGYCLRALGRLTESLDVMRAALEITTRQRDWSNAASDAGNVSEVELILGQVAAAVRDGKKCVKYGDKIHNDYRVFVWSRMPLADALHQYGRRAEAFELYREAEAMQARWERAYPRLYSLRGFQYCELLLAEPECAAWAKFLGYSPTAAGAGPKPAAQKDVLRDVEQRGRNILEWQSRDDDPIFDIALCHLTLGRVLLYRALLEGGADRPAGQRDPSEASKRIPGLASARVEMDTAVNGLADARRMHHSPRSLLSRAWLRLMQGDPGGAAADLDEAWQIAERGAMKLHMADIHLHRARLFRDRAALEAATRLIKETGYHRRDDELRDAQEAAQHWPEEPDYPLPPEADSSDTSGDATLDAERGSTQDLPAAAQEKPMPEPNAPKPVFISYAHKDNEGTDPAKHWLDRLKEHLEPLVQQDNITVCSDQDIGLGDDWHGHIQAQLNGARAAVLLVSPAFLASKYIRNNELPVLLRNAKANGVKIIPVIVRPCLFEETKFKYPDPKSGPEEFTLASLQAAGSPTKALSEMSEGEQDRTLVKVAQALAKLVNAELRNGLAVPVAAPVADPSPLKQSSLPVKGKDAMRTYQFNPNRLRQLEELLDIEYEKLHEFDKAIALADGIGQKIALRQQIKRELTPRLRKLEQEYAELLAAGVQTEKIPEADAQELVAELVGALVKAEEAKPANAPQEMVRLLSEIRDKLDEPGKSASAKLKVSLPIIPLISSYEIEWDTAGVLTGAWRNTRDFFKRLVSDRPN